MDDDMRHDVQLKKTYKKVKMITDNEIAHGSSPRWREKKASQPCRSFSSQQVSRQICIPFRLNRLSGLKISFDVQRTNQFMVPPRVPSLNNSIIVIDPTSDCT
jgi:hypothetical protein